MKKKSLGQQFMKLPIEHQSIKFLICLKKTGIGDADLGSQCPNLMKKACRSVVKNFMQGNSDLDSLK